MELQDQSLRLDEELETLQVHVRQSRALSRALSNPSLASTPKLPPPSSLAFREPHQQRRPAVLDAPTAPGHVHIPVSAFQVGHCTHSPLRRPSSKSSNWSRCYLGMVSQDCLFLQPGVRSRLAALHPALLTPIHGLIPPLPAECSARAPAPPPAAAWARSVGEPAPSAPAWSGSTHLPWLPSTPASGPTGIWER